MSTREQKIVKVGIVGIFMNVTLVVIKGTIGLLSGSIAILLDALNNLTDILSALVTVIGAKLASRAPDKNHPYGHGRLEDVSAFLVGLIILAAGVGAVVEAAPKILNSTPADYSPLSLIFIALAVVTKFVFSRYAEKAGKTLDSSSLVATGADAFFDSLLSLSTLVAALVSLFFSIHIEGFVGVIIGAFIIKTSIEILSETIKSLVGLRASGELTQKIKQTIRRFPEVDGVYDLMIHNYGPVELFGSVHIQVEDKMTAKEIHRLTRDISLKVYEKYGVILTVGIYAKNTSLKEFSNIRTALDRFMKSHPEVLQVHGFYADKSTKTVAFDLVLDFSCQNKEKLRDTLVSDLSKNYPGYKYQVTLDLDASD